MNGELELDLIILDFSFESTAFIPKEDIVIGISCTS